MYQQREGNESHAETVCRHDRLKGVSLFAGCFFEQKQVDHGPAIEDMLKMLKDWGFEVKRVFADRGFTSYDLISAMNDLGLLIQDRSSGLASSRPWSKHI